MIPRYDVRTLIISPSGIVLTRRPLRAAIIFPLHTTGSLLERSHASFASISWGPELSPALHSLAIVAWPTRAILRSPRRWRPDHLLTTLPVARVNVR